MSAPLFKFDYLRSVFEGNEKQVSEVIELFLSELPEITQQLSETWKQKKRQEFRRAAHKLKSSLRTIGCDMLADLALQLELHAEEEETVVLPFFQQLSDSLPYLETQLRAHLKSGQVK